MNSELSFKYFQFILGTLVLGGVTLYVNSDYNNRKLKLEQFRNKTELSVESLQVHKDLELRELALLGEFVNTAIDAEPGARRRFAEYFATLSTSDSLKQNWIYYRDSVVGKEVNNIKGIIDSLDEVLLTLDGADAAALNNHIIHLNKKIEGNLLYSSSMNAYSVSAELDSLKKNQQQMLTTQRGIIDDQKKRWHIK